MIMPNGVRLSGSLVTAFAAVLLSAVFSQNATAQETLLSTAENYYQFLALNGDLERPYLNYRSLSDSDWDTTGLSGDIWAENNLGTKRLLGDNLSFRIYGPELFTSYNSAVPYGQNDGALWQGRGFNSSLTAGARGELSFGDATIELTFKPVVYGSQNLAFDMVPPAYSDSESDGTYAGKASEYGYFGVKYLDAPQRFGDDPLSGYSWGDSEIRIGWKTLTAGFGTQAVWLGPARINPILMSNNAPPFPKADIGLRKTELTMPWLGCEMGSFETRALWGYLTESDWFDNDSPNNHNLLTALSVSYAPPFADNLTLGFHRTMLSKWDAMDYESMLTLVWPFMSNSAGKDERDQRASITLENTYPTVGFSWYVEWGRNDFSPSIDFLIRYPFHTQGYTVGAEKSFELPLPFTHRAFINFELTNLESSRDYELIWPTTFYSHGIIKQGHTHDGQWLGAGAGTGGNSQYLGLTIYTKPSAFTIFAQRTNPDLDYVWYLNSSDGQDEKRMRADLSIGGTFTCHVSPGIELNSGCTLTQGSNVYFEPLADSKHRYSMQLTFGATMSL